MSGSRTRQRSGSSTSFSSSSDSATGPHSASLLAQHMPKRPKPSAPARLTAAFRDRAIKAEMDFALQELAGISDDTNWAVQLLRQNGLAPLCRAVSQTGYPRLIRLFYQNLVAEDAYHFATEIDGHHLIVTPALVAEAWGIPFARPPTSPLLDGAPDHCSLHDMIIALGAERLTRPPRGQSHPQYTHIVRSELHPRLYLLDQILHTNAYGFAGHEQERRDPIVRALYYFTQGYWYCPAYLVTHAMIQVATKIQAKPASPTQLPFPMLITKLLANDSFPTTSSEPSLPRDTAARLFGARRYNVAMGRMGARLTTTPVTTSSRQPSTPPTTSARTSHPSSSSAPTSSRADHLELLSAIQQLNISQKNLELGQHEIKEQIGRMREHAAHDVHEITGLRELHYRDVEAPALQQMFHQSERFQIEQARIHGTYLDDRFEELRDTQHRQFADLRASHQDLSNNIQASFTTLQATLTDDMAALYRAEYDRALLDIRRRQDPQ